MYTMDYQRANVPGKNTFFFLTGLLSMVKPQEGFKIRVAHHRTSQQHERTVVWLSTIRKETNSSRLNVSHIICNRTPLQNNPSRKHVARKEQILSSFSREKTGNNGLRKCSDFARTFLLLIVILELSCAHDLVLCVHFHLTVTPTAILERAKRVKLDHGTPVLHEDKRQDVPHPSARRSRSVLVVGKPNKKGRPIKKEAQARAHNIFRPHAGVPSFGAEIKSVSV